MCATGVVYQKVNRPKSFDRFVDCPGCIISFCKIGIYTPPLPAQRPPKMRSQDFTALPPMKNSCPLPITALI